MSDSNPFQLDPAEYDRWYDKYLPAYQSELACLSKVLPDSGEGLEIGVGTGRFSGTLGIRWGLDPVREVLDRARRRGVGVVQGRGESLPFIPGSFDYVLIVTVLCFLSDPARMIEEVREVLRPAGKLILGLIDRESFLGRLYQEKKRKSRFFQTAEFFTVPEVIKLLSPGAWKEVDICQTIFEMPPDIDSVQPPREGYGEGGFVVVSTRKTR
ncbi:MAG: class I SAM-dependent methyltransferase [Candidatus Euphemobacter frigidus]|nr:class I SAM-dependent methyltransferase [Candidatus Euphemobacter frigidus]MDP8276518.1 class I SAM-dependent methyltransferase [Candidatus Euphemobacter frigidus]